MKKLSLGLTVVGMLLVATSPLLAQAESKEKADLSFAAGDRGAGAFYGNAIAAGLGAGLTIIGAGIGFGKIGSAALESMARQPEVAPRVGTSMLIIAALLEGATFFSLIVCILMANAAARNVVAAAGG